MPVDLTSRLQVGSTALRLPPFGQGTGLGLTIVHDIVVGEFGGTIDVESEIGSGSVFILRFPLPTD